MIHLVTLFSIDLDADLIPHFIEHYKALELDSYTCFLNSSARTDKDFAKACQITFESSGFDVVPIEKPFQQMTLRKHLFDDFKKTLPKQDFLLTVDSDELQMWPQRPREMVETYDLFQGDLIDCYDDRLKYALPGVPLDKQFPRQSSRLESTIYKNCLTSLRLNYNKILMAKNTHNICYLGSHGLIDPISPTINMYSGMIVEHYRWRKSIYNRLASKNYYKLEHKQAIEQFFTE